MQRQTCQDRTGPAAQPHRVCCALVGFPRQAILDPWVRSFWISLAVVSLKGHLQEHKGHWHQNIGFRRKCEHLYHWRQRRVSSHKEVRWQIYTITTKGHFVCVDVCHTWLHQLMIHIHRGRFWIHHSSHTSITVRLQSSLLLSISFTPQHAAILHCATQWCSWATVHSCVLRAQLYAPCGGLYISIYGQVEGMLMKCILRGISLM